MHTHAHKQFLHIHTQIRTQAYNNNIRNMHTAKQNKVNNKQQTKTSKPKPKQANQTKPKQNKTKQNYTFAK